MSKFSRFTNPLHAELSDEEEQRIFDMKSDKEDEDVGNVKFSIGDKVRKIKGYAFDSEIRSVFLTKSGEVRVVAEMTTKNGEGLLHIFNQSQLERYE